MLLAADRTMEKRLNPTLIALKRLRARLPLGLVVALVAWALLVLVYVWLTYWRSPEYQAAVHVETANALLGKDDGVRASPAELSRAYEELLEAARLVPEERELHTRLEHLNWRFEQRGLTLDPELRNRADAVAIVAARMEAADRPYLVVGARDYGWTPDALLAGPLRALWWLLIGAMLIVAIWAWRTFSFGSRVLSARNRRLEELEAEVRALAFQREEERRIHPGESEETRAEEPSVSGETKPVVAPPIDQRSAPYRDIFKRIEEHRTKRAAKRKPEWENDEDATMEEGPTEFDPGPKAKKGDRRKG